MENYVLKTFESNRVPKGNQKGKKAILIILAILLIGSFVFGANLFGELSLATKLILLALFFKTVIGGGYELKSTPLEIHFYDTFMEIHRMDVYYNEKLQRKEIYVYNYIDIKRSDFYRLSNKIVFTGKTYTEWFDYNPDKTLPDTPTVKKTTESMCYFYTNADPRTNIINEIETHSPIRIQILDK